MPLSDELIIELTYGPHPANATASEENGHELLQIQRRAPKGDV
jgi:hypothetical protein